jgi:hypothetical protein
VIVECQRHSDYQESIKWLLAFIEEYAGHAKTVGGHGQDVHGTLTNVSAFDQSANSVLLMMVPEYRSADLLGTTANSA